MRSSLSLSTHMTFLQTAANIGIRIELKKDPSLQRPHYREHNVPWSIVSTKRGRHTSTTTTTYASKEKLLSWVLCSMVLARVSSSSWAYFPQNPPPSDHTRRIENQGRIHISKSSRQGYTSSDCPQHIHLPKAAAAATLLTVHSRRFYGPSPTCCLVPSITGHDPLYTCYGSIMDEPQLSSYLVALGWFIL